MYKIEIKNLKTGKTHEMAASVDPSREKEDVAEAARWQMINIHGLQPGEWQVLSYGPIPTL
uniref:hypothetical protein n=1 Tax=Trichocoleus desertorum TaxID=1481672 RepID=UPI0025B5C114|nr:hypothetical protein [Trichocoleus desertorum]